MSLTRSLRTLGLTALLGLGLTLAAACDDGGGDDATTDTTVVTDTTVSEDSAASETFACGAVTTCDIDGQGCASRGQGACIGDPPDANGSCGPDCHPYECGGATTCLCDTYWCVDLPSGCDSCACAEAPDASCECDDSGGQVVFSCMGA